MPRSGDTWDAIAIRIVTHPTFIGAAYLFSMNYFFASRKDRAQLAALQDCKLYTIKEVRTRGQQQQQQPSSSSSSSSSGGSAAASSSRREDEYVAVRGVIACDAPIVVHPSSPPAVLTERQVVIKQRVTMPRTTHKLRTVYKRLPVERDVVSFSVMDESDSRGVQIRNIMQAEPKFLNELKKKTWEENDRPIKQTVEETIKSINQGVLPLSATTTMNVIPVATTVTVIGNAVYHPRDDAVTMSQPSSHPFVISQQSLHTIVEECEVAAKQHQNLWNFWFGVAMAASCIKLYKWLQIQWIRHQERNKIEALLTQAKHKQKKRQQELKDKGLFDQANDLQEEQDNLPAQAGYGECILCYDDSATIAFSDCGHMVCCRACSEQLSICPMCKAPISRKIFIFIN